MLRFVDVDMAWAVTASMLLDAAATFDVDAAYAADDVANRKVPIGRNGGAA